MSRTYKDRDYDKKTVIGKPHSAVRQEARDEIEEGLEEWLEERTNTPTSRKDQRQT